MHQSNPRLYHGGTNDAETQNIQIMISKSTANSIAFQPQLDKTERYPNNTAFVVGSLEDALQGDDRVLDRANHSETEGEGHKEI